MAAHNEASVGQKTGDKTGQRNTDRIIGVLTLLAGMAIVWQALAHLHFGTFHHPGPGFFPLLLSFIIIFLSLFLVFSPGKAGAGTLSFSARTLKRVCPVYVALLAFFAILEFAGFLISTFLLVSSLFLLSGKVKLRGAVIGSLIATVLSYLFFNLVLKSELPRGLLGF